VQLRGAGVEHGVDAGGVSCLDVVQVVVDEQAALRRDCQFLQRAGVGLFSGLRTPSTPANTIASQRAATPGKYWPTNDPTSASLLLNSATTAGGRAAPITANAAGSSWKAAIHAASTSSGAQRNPKRPLIPALTPSASNSPLSATSTNPLLYNRAATSPGESPHNRPNATSLGWRSNAASTPARSINKCVGATHTMLKTNDARLPETDRHDDIRREMVGLSAGGRIARGGYGRQPVGGRIVQQPLRCWDCTDVMLATVRPPSPPHHSRTSADRKAAFQ